MAPPEPQPNSDADLLSQLLFEIKACRICVDNPNGDPLPHEPRPVLQARASARLAIFGQAPGLKVHHAGKPFMDPSGVRLRNWMGIGEEDFYEPAKVAIIPMGFCFPGYDKKGGDLPPRRECAVAWRARVLAELPNLELVLLVGQYAQAWHLGADKRRTLTETVAAWRDYLAKDSLPRLLPLPHPSWRNNAWISKNLWFEMELLPELKRLVQSILRRP
ncbi:MAG: uracil-DNA glycosylase family protein [Filomicrobium sp.]